MAALRPTIRLNNADLPTFGRPTSATAGIPVLLICRHPERSEGSAVSWQMGRLPLRSPGRQSRSFASLRMTAQDVDEVVRRIDGECELASQLLEHDVIKEDAGLVDRLGRNQRQIEIIAPTERLAHVRADQEASGGGR